MLRLDSSIGDSVREDSMYGFDRNFSSPQGRFVGSRSAPKKEMKRGPPKNRHPPMVSEGDLPSGKWELDADSGLHFSQDEYLFFYKATGMYYDPVSTYWYDPYSRKWFLDGEGDTTEASDRSASEVTVFTRENTLELWRQASEATVASSTVGNVRGAWLDRTFPAPTVPGTLPTGFNWVEVPDFSMHFCHEKDIYFHVPTGNYFDYRSGLWYDPIGDEWYEDNGERTHVDETDGSGPLVAQDSAIEEQVAVDDDSSEGWRSPPSSSSEEDEASEAPVDVGDRVFVKDKDDNLWYPGKVDYVSSRSRVSVETRTTWIEVNPKSGIVRKERVEVGDTVRERWMSHRPLKVISRYEEDYDIDYDDGDKESSVPPHLIKRIGEDEAELGATYQVGDRIEAQWRGYSTWYRGKISYVNRVENILVEDEGLNRTTYEQDEIVMTTDDLQAAGYTVPSDPWECTMPPFVKRHKGKMCCGFWFIAILTAILVGESFAYIEVNEIGFKKTDATGDIDRGTVYGTGRYYWGLGKSAVTFPAKYQSVELLRLAAFVSGGQEVFFDVRFFYRLQKETLADMYEAVRDNFDNRIRTVSEAALKNAATLFNVEDFIQNRNNVSNVLYQYMELEVRNKTFVSVPRSHFTVGHFNLPPTIGQQKIEVFASNQAQVTADYSKQGTQVRLETTRQVTALDTRAKLIEENATASSARLVQDANSRAFERVETEKGDGQQVIISALTLSNATSEKKLLQILGILDRSATITQPVVIGGIKNVVGLVDLATVDGSDLPPSSVPPPSSDPVEDDNTDDEPPAVDDNNSTSANTEN